MMNLRFTAAATRGAAPRRTRAAGLWIAALLGSAAAIVELTLSPAAPAAAGAQVTRPAVITYTQLSGQVPHLWMMNVDTRHRWQLTFGRYGEETASWSPNGRMLAYVEMNLHNLPGLSEPQITTAIVIRDIAKHSVRSITTGRDLDETPAWSPTGRTIAFVRAIIPLGSETGPPEEVWTIGTNGRGLRQLTHNSLSDIAPAWSPTGRSIVYQRARDSSATHWDIWIMRSDGSGQRLLARDGTRPAWSPDGRLIAFGQPTREIRGCCVVTNLMVMSHDGTHRRLLLKNAGRPSWSPDGSRIVFQRISGRHSDLWIVNRDGSHPRRLSQTAVDEFATSWRPGAR